MYFSWLLVIVPVIGLIENTLQDIATDSTISTSPSTISSSSSSSSSSYSSSKISPLPNRIPKGLRGYSTTPSKITELSLEEAKAELERRVETYTLEDSLNDKQFKELANGCLQAEGCATAKFSSKKSHWASPHISINQNRWRLQFFHSASGVDPPHPRVFGPYM
jgi:hypothetical protein